MEAAAVFRHSKAEVWKQHLMFLLGEYLSLADEQRSSETCN